MEIFNKRDKDSLSIDDDVFVPEYEMKGRIVSIEDANDDREEAVFSVKLNNGEVRHFTAESLTNPE